MSITQAYIKHIPEFPLTVIEEFCEEWVEQEGQVRDEVLPYLIQEKLRIYEKEY